MHLWRRSYLNREGAGITVTIQCLGRAERHAIPWPAHRREDLADVKRQKGPQATHPPGQGPKISISPARKERSTIPQQTSSDSVISSAPPRKSTTSLPIPIATRFSNHRLPRIASVPPEFAIDAHCIDLHRYTLLRASPPHSPTIVTAAPKNTSPLPPPSRVGLFRSTPLAAMSL